MSELYDSTSKDTDAFRRMHRDGEPCFHSRVQKLAKELIGKITHVARLFALPKRVHGR